MSGTILRNFKEDEEEEDEDDVSSSSRPSTREDEDTISSSMTKSVIGGAPTCVQVALRIRPLLPREVIANAQECINVTPNEPQVYIAGSHAFTYDFVFPKDAQQDEIFVNVAKPLVDGILEGYNATILAYGQTGSGKTFTMGTGFDPGVLTSSTQTQGILPRCITYLFDGIRERTVGCNPAPDFKVSVQFTELYNEEVIDLLSDAPSRPGTARNQVKIQERSNGEILLVNICNKPVRSGHETLEALKNGALNRTTASTNMNDQSSRSHAIFTIHVNQNRVTRDKSGASDIETLSGKFHFVDLAGSERLKRTGATGDRAREGIAINSGLLALGNVISALGDKSKKSQHVPYRDSKLTRLLQDSLGGNSRTLMIACVSPNELDFVETLNTMKYANRAKNIKNKVVVNQDKSSRTINLLKEEIASLKQELMEYKRGVKGSSVDEACSDVNAENIMLLAEVDTLRCKLKSKQDTIEHLTSIVARLQAVTVANDGEECDLTNLVSKYLVEIEGLRGQLYESETECEKLRTKQRAILKNLTSPRDSGVGPGSHTTVSVLAEAQESVTELLQKAKAEVMTQKKVVNKTEKSSSETHISSPSSSSDEEEEDDEDEEEEEVQDTSNYVQLADLTQEINTKQRLIEELENSQLRLESMKTKYEEKLSQLSTKIRCTEEERDAVMSKSTMSVDKSREYETKITSLQQELKRWNNAKREHQKLLKNQSSYEAQIGKLRREIEDMKRMKVKLMNQVKNENLRHREVEKQRLKEITQLRKEARVKDIKVRKLESDQRLKEAVLKRKLEEVENLKMRNRGKLNNTQVRTKGASPVKGKQAWGRIQSSIIKEVSDRGNVASLEREMMSLISRRAELNEQLSREGDLETRDSINSNLRLVESKIREVQEEIVCSNGDGDNEHNSRDRAARVNLAECANVHDYSYVFDKLYEQLITSMTESSSLEGKVKEIDAANRHLQNEVETLRELLHHMYTRSPGARPPPELEEMPPPTLPPPTQVSMKARRRLTSTTQELLGSSETLENESGLNKTFTRSRLTQSLRGNKSNIVRKRVPVLTRQDTYSVINNTSGGGGGSHDMNQTFVLIEPSTTNESTTNNMKTTLVRSVSEVTSEHVPRRTGNGNIKSPRSNGWLSLQSRLEGHTKPIVSLAATNQLLVSGSKDATARVWDIETSTLTHAFTDHPHNVSAVCYVPEMSLVFTGSGYQLRAYDLRLPSTDPIKVLSSSGSILPSSTPQQQSIPSLPQSTTLPRVNELPPGERVVQSIQPVRNYFYTSFGERIKIWDLRKLAIIGMIPGKHASSVMCITGQESGLRSNDWVITGSKDHSIKVYEYEPNTLPENITSVRNLAPPHYDGIECLLMHQNKLYSGSRDTCIKKWDLESFRNVSTVTNAHSGWITGMCAVPKYSYESSDFIVSCSRDGQLKLWDCGGREFREICRYEGNVGMDCVASNDTCLFFGGANNNGVSVCQINERTLQLIVQYQSYSTMSGVVSSSSSSRDRSLSTSSRASPTASPKFRRKVLGAPPHHQQLNYLSSGYGGSTDNIMTRSTGGVDFLNF